MAPKDTFYVYKPLETSSSIRLIEIHGTSKLPRYTLIHTTVEDTLPYETLSYVWGTPKRKACLELGDGTRLPITKHLQSLLPKLHDFVTTGYLWIDQICINQEDTKEKSCQVRLMGKIYSMCLGVLVWLDARISGEPEFVSKILARTKPDFQTNYAQSLGIDKGYLEQLTQAELTPTERGDVYSYSREIFTAPWFRRAWVFQEVVLPPGSKFIMLVGKDRFRRLCTMSLSDLYSIQHVVDEMAFVKLIMVKLGRLRRPVIYDMYEQWWRRHGSGGLQALPFEQAISLLSPEACTSVKFDQLFAFYGLNEDPNIGLQPKYDVIFSEALTSLTLSIIRGTQSVEVFEVIPRRSQDIKLPSWIPDFRYLALSTPFRKSSADGSDNSSPNLLYQWKGSCDSHTLRVCGKVVDTFVMDLGAIPTRLFSSPKFISISRGFLKLLKKLVRKEESLFTSQPTGLLTHNLVGRILQALFAEGHCESVTSETSDTVENPEFLETIRLLYEGLDQKTGEWKSESNMEDAMTKLLNRKYEAMVALPGRRLWTTQSGLFATGCEIRSGDVICVIHGCSNPVALRPKKDNTYTVQGTCYLEGWMDPWSSGKVTWKEDEGTECVVI